MWTIKRTRLYTGDFEDDATGSRFVLPRCAFLLALYVYTQLRETSRVYTHPQVAVSDDEVKQERICGKMRTKVLPSRTISHQVSFSGPRKKCFSIIIGIKELPEAKSPSTLQIPLFSCCKEEVFIFVLFPCFDSPSRRRRRDSIHRTFSLFYFSIGYL